MVVSPEATHHHIHARYDVLPVVLLITRCTSSAYTGYIIRYIIVTLEVHQASNVVLHIATQNSF